MNHVKHNTIPRRAAALLLSLLLVLALCPPVTAADDGEKVVRVGYVNAVNYEEGGEGEYKRGSGYEYLQKISYLTGWKYEYVYGSFKDCYRMLADGEIDLFGNLSYTRERAEEISYATYPQGKDTYWLYTTRNHADLLGGDLNELNGCRIGVTEGSYQAELLTTWLKENQIQAETVNCSGYSEMMASLDDGTLDAIITPDLANSYEYATVVSIGFSDYYFGVAQDRPDLLEELNAALYEIQNSEVDYNNNLATRYYTNMTGSQTLNREEQTWLAAHNNTLRLGYLADNLPFSGEEDGRLVGVLNTVVETLRKDMGVSVEAQVYPDLETMKAALRAGTIDLAGPVIGDFYLCEQNDLVLSDSIIDTTPVILYRGEDYDSSLTTIAATAASVFTPDIVSILYPDAEVLACDSQADCLKAVVQGRAGSAIIPSSRLNILMARPEMKNLSFAEMSRRVEVRLIASKSSRRAATIMNKAISQASDVLNGVVLAQHSASSQEVPFTEYVRRHLVLFGTLSGAIIALLAYQSVRLSISKRRLSAALEEAQSASVAKTTFLSSMSHDIRTPMNAIMGYTTIAQKQNPSPEIQNCLEKIEESSGHLLSLLNEVLDVSRIESGKLQLNRAAVDITTVSDTVLDVARGFLVGRDIDLQIQRDKPDRPYVLADQARIQEVLINILGNAVKFTEDGGRITFTEEYRPGPGGDRLTVCYRIADTGVGMSQEFQARVFDAFAQENAGARTRYQGTGLGLAITKRYVELMGGTVTVDSEKGKGSTFVVELPLERTAPPETETPAAPAAERDLTGVKVLMAEDNDLNAEIAAALMEERGIQVTRAVDGQDAVDRFAAAPPHTFDLILMDIMMPRMNGLEAARAIRSLAGRPDGADIPILAMTANAFAEDVQATLDAGMNAHLSKPIDMDQVVQTMAKYLPG